MNVVIRKSLADIRRRKLQTLVIAVVIVLSSGAASLALNLLVESDAPFDHAFAAAHGAHLSLTYSGVTLVQLQHTASRPHVVQTAGPWPEAQVGLKGSVPLPGNLTVVGRPAANTLVDRLTMQSGRWAQRTGEIVLSRDLADLTGLGAGDRVTADVPGRPSLLITGIASAVNPDVSAWVSPREIASLSGGRPMQYQMLYRVSPAATEVDMRHATQSITRGLPAGSVIGIDDYLTRKHSADLTTGVMIPFLIAFSVIALLAAAFVISNVVSGVVVAEYREIGVMKSVGFTPGQVVGVLLEQILIPVLAGCAGGIALGMIVSQPFLQQTAHALDLPSPFTASGIVIALVALSVAAVAIVSALLPAWHAARMSAVAAITAGSAPAARRHGGVERRMLALPFPRPLTLGLADAVARPYRSIMTMGAILMGVAAVIFGLGLHFSLDLVAQHLIRDKYVQVDVSVPTAQMLNGISKPGLPPISGTSIPSERQIASWIRHEPGTSRYVAESQGSINVPGIAEPIPYYAYQGGSSWLGYALINGRWFSRPGEVVAPTALMRQSGLKVGDRFVAHVNGRSVHLRLVGEILDQSDNDLLLRGSWATLRSVDPGLLLQQFEIQLLPGTNPELYARGLRDASVLGPNQPSVIGVDTVQNSSHDSGFVLINGVIEGLAVVLIGIALAGVFNTVILATRERTRDMAILKAVGMAPQQVVSMVVASVTLPGLIAGVLAIPLGLLLYRLVLALMAQIASGTDLPSSFYDAIDHAALPLLALSGVVIAAIGAWLPAQWAASSGVADVLQTE